MRTYNLYVSGGMLTKEISGVDIVDAVTNNFGIIGKDAGVGNAAGWVLDKVTLEYKNGILGCKGGVEVKILAHGQDFPHRKVNPTPKEYIAWIYADADDLLEPVEIKLR